MTRPVVKPLASKHHAELQRITDRACARFPDLAALEAAFATSLSGDELAELAFAWAKQVMALGGWGWWSISDDGRLNPALVAWNKAWFVVPIDCVLALYESRGSLAATLERIGALPKGNAGDLKPFTR